MDGGKKPVIEFKDFSFQYKVQSKPTLFDINLTIYEGEKILLLGPSGSGKSTLANCINGLIPVSIPGKIEGSLKVAGMETRDCDLNQLSALVGTVLQDSDAQFVGLSVGEDIAFALENMNMPRDRMIPLVEKSASIVGMESFLNHLPYKLSGGQKQKVALAGVMHEDVRVLLFDEPLASLDPQMGMIAVDLIDRICRSERKTVLIIEHRLEDVLYRPVDRIILIDGGRIILDTTPEDLLRRYDLLAHGIREPLYITAMKYAGCNLDEEDILSHVSGMTITPGNRDKLIHFFQKEAPSSIEAGKEELIRVTEASFTYSSKLPNALDRVNCVIHKGEIVSLIGENGAGKTTFARMICGISRPQAGTVEIDGKSYLTLSIREIGERIGYVMQNPNQMIVKSIIKEEVALALTLRGMSEDEIDKRVEKALRMCRLYTMRHWPVDAVSYGQKKRITIAAILALEPDAIILDEPTAGQDYHNYTAIMEFILTLNRDYGKTILFITHDMHLAIEFTDRAIVFAKAEIIADSSVFEVLSDDGIISKASLKQTSLYTLATKIGLEPRQVIRHFVAYEKAVRANGR
ncbi:MAG TPA: ABC transporter ATP-binding protein [Bacillota bacterium]|jgi:energy-coupling factor transport system ATP-binding protein|nr:ABC transporter ATP-binding protein [Fastidiosipila sp.]HPX92975.1 ABC transporter ATP-binding protein [Bacillota bacterium]HQB80789.1 ABC transporter ATP-binding protein [Bacillota bacterium]